MKIAFFGGDARMRIAMEYLKAQGIECVGWGVPGAETDPDPLRGAQAAVFPLPCERNGVLNAPAVSDPPSAAALWGSFGSPDVPVIGGPVSPNPFRRFSDLSRNERLKSRNAVATAEGALALFTEHTSRTVCGSRCLVVGYGAIGKRLSRILTALGSFVTVSARREIDLTAVADAGMRVQRTDALKWDRFDAVFNTVPARVMGDAFLKDLPADTLLVELASAPGGFDPEAVSRYGLTVLPAPGLPGKVAPVTAGEDLAKTVIEILNDF